MSAPLFAEPQDENIALNYVGAAAEEIGKNNWDKAALYINTAEQFSTAFSDYWYIKALIDQYNDHIDESLADINKASDIDLWHQFSLRDAMAMKSKLLIHLRRYHDQLDLYQETYPLYKNDKEILSLTCESAFRGGFFEKADDIIQYGKSFFPGEPVFYLYDLLLKNNTESFNALLFVCDKYGKSVLPYLEEYLYIKQRDSLPQIKDYYSTEAEPGYMKEYLLFETGISLYGTPSDIAVNVKDMVTLNRYYISLRDAEAKQDLLKGINGEYYVDWNRDKIPEEIGFWRNGSLVSWSIDEDQDGILDFEVRFNDKTQPVWAASSGLKISYSVYPKVDSVNAEKKIGIDTVYFFDYGAFVLDIIDWDITEQLIPDFLDYKIEEERLLTLSFKVFDEYSDKILRSYTVYNKKIVQIEEDLDLNGFIDHKLDVKNNKIISGLRDLNEDGQFEIYENYKNGSWFGFAYDSDGDNIPEYYEDWSLIKIKIWDTDQDKVIDIASYRDYENIISRKDSLLFPLLLNKDDFLTWDFNYERHWFK